MGVRRLFSRRGQKNTIRLKMLKNLLFSFKKVEKHPILLAKGGGGGGSEEKV